MTKPKASVPHDQAIIRHVREDQEFAVDYLKAALEESDEPRVLPIALRHITRARGIPSR